MTNIVETTIVLGTTGLIVALFANAYNKALGITHKREIELLEETYKRRMSDCDKSIRSLNRDIEVIISEMYTNDEKEIVRKYHLQRIQDKVNMDNIFNSSKNAR